MKDDMATKVVAEISIRRVGSAWFPWVVFAPGRKANDQAGHARSPTEALWRAVDHLRELDAGVPASGRIAVYSHDGARVAYAPVWAVPQYEYLQWMPIDVAEVHIGSPA